MKAQQKQKIKRVISLAYSPCFWLKRSFSKKPKFTVLMYHSVNPGHQWSIQPKDFERQVKFLTLNYWVSGLKDFFGFEKNAFSITFDDGYEDNYLHALPILKKYNCPATFFLCTGFIKKEIDITKKGVYQGLKPLSFEQIKEMKKQGMEFGSHTHSHPILSKISLKKAEEEIKKSKDILENILAERINFFAYPLGQSGTFNKGIISILKEKRFQMALSTIWGSNTKESNPFSLRRIRIDRGDTFEDFKNKIEGRWDFINYFQRFICQRRY